MMIGPVAEENLPIHLISTPDPPPDSAPAPAAPPTWTIAISPDQLVQQVVLLYKQIAALDDLRPSDPVNALFSQLVSLCLHPCAIDLDKELAPEVQQIREDLIKLCGTAEGLLEHHYSSIIGAFPQPYDHLHLFPYHHNYVKLASEEFRALCAAASRGVPPSLSSGKIKGPGCMQNACACAAFTRVAFVGSGPMPLTSIVLASNHMPWATFDNYDLDAEANEKAEALVRANGNLSNRMRFVTRNIKKVKKKMEEYDLVFLAALVGMDRASKAEFLDHLAKYMRAEATVVVRSAHSGRAFLYPVVDEEMLAIAGFDVLSVYHPTDEVVNSVVVARKRGAAAQTPGGAVNPSPR